MTYWLAQLQLLAPVAAAGLVAAASVIHILLYKRDPRGAFGWIGVCLLFPFVGPALYYVFGINRVRIRAQRLDERATHAIGRGLGRGGNHGIDGDLLRSHQAIPESLTGLAAASDTLATAPLVPGNTLRALYNGEQAFPAMLDAIRGARRRVYLASYIFDTDGAGKQFIDALAEAHGRGVDVRVLIDGVGEYYALPRRRAGSLLRRRGVAVARFLRPRLLPPSLSINLRNHRKILAVDGELAFTGGMNIGDRHLDIPRKGRKAADVHFALSGPVVAQIERVFLTDWAFVTGEAGEPSPPAPGAGPAVCRVVDDGPTDTTDRLGTLLATAVVSARRRVLIMTPYFLPEAGLIGALQAAALRRIEVSVVLPAKNNLSFVNWAARHGLRELLARGVNIYYQPPPFVHSKLFVIDDTYAVIGTANIDPRSLRLNFELGVEVYDPALVAELGKHITDCIAKSRRYTLEDYQQRRLPARLRDALAWLFMPYL